MSNCLQSEGDMCFEAEFFEINNGKKSGEMRAPGPAAEVGKSVAKEIRTIE